jgi:hypothetical protein
MATQTPAAKLKWALLAVLALVMAWTAWSAYRQSKDNMEQLNSWTRHEARIESQRYEGWSHVEISKALAQSLPNLRRPEHDTSHEPDKALVMLARQPFAWHDTGDQVQLAQDPAQPDRLILLNETAMWLPVAAKLLLLALLAVCWKWLSVTPWGGDRTWTNGAWQETDAMAVRPGSGALLAEHIKEPKGNQKFWAVLGLVIALPFALWMLTGIISHPLEAGVLLVVALGILGLSLRSAVKVHTRRVQFDEAGLSDTDFFGVRRMPWSAVKGLKVVNLNLKEQQRYDRARLRDREGSRPEDDPAWNVCGEQGVVLLQLYRNMVPQDALAALRQRIQQQLHGGGKDAFGFAKQRPAPRAAEAPDAFAAEMEAFTGETEANGGRVLDPNDPRDRKLIEEYEAIGRRMDQIGTELAKQGKSAERIVQVFMALVFLLPLVGTCYLGYQSLWFKFAAAEAQGRVVAIAAEYQPALVVEYRNAAGRILRIKSDPSEDYAGVAVGASVRVFYDPANPDWTRLDLFDEMWFGTLFLGGLTLFVGLLAGAVWWGTMRTAKTKSKVRRAAGAG